MQRGGRLLLFRRMFFCLFSAVTEALCLIQAGCVKEAERKLTAAQQTTEDMYRAAKDIKT